MWFMDQIVSWLNSVAQYFLDAYYTVSGWVFPFYYLSTPLYWLYYAFFYIAYYFSQFNAWLDWAAGRISVILGYYDIWSYFEYWFSAAQNAWSWVSNAFYNVWNVCNSWWSSAQYTVIAWVNDVKNYATALFNQANTWLASLQSAWDSFKGKIPSIDAIVSWWGNWWGNILGQLGTWWNSRLLDVQNLINSAFLARESFWAGWQDWRTKVAEFFTDPEDWLYKAADRIIERFW